MCLFVTSRNNRDDLGIKLEKGLVKYSLEAEVARGTVQPVYTSNALISLNEEMECLLP